MSEAGLAEPIEELRSAARSLRQPMFPAGVIPDTADVVSAKEDQPSADAADVTPPSTEPDAATASPVARVFEHAGAASTGADWSWL
jgi:hypothetical protein